MKVAVMQPYLFPALSYFQLVGGVERFVLYDDVNYISRGFINRNSVLDQGKVRRFSVPVPGASINRRICELAFSPEVSSIVEGLRHAYARAPQFAAVYPWVREVLTGEERDITTLCRHAIEATFDYLDWPVSITRASCLDYDRDQSAADRLITITRLQGGDHYVNSLGGQRLYDREAFAARGVRLSFLQPREVGYSQGQKSFVPRLSMIDVLMWCSRDRVSELLEAYDLI